MNRRSSSLPRSIFRSRAFLRRPLRHVSAAATVALLLGSQYARAANGPDTWLGNTDANWATAANWTAASINKPPISGDSLVFNADGTAGSGTTPVADTLTNTLTTSAFNVNGITFGSAAPAYTMTGNTLNLTAGITNSSTSLQTFSNTGGLTSTGNITYTLGGGITLTNGLANTDGTNNRSLTANGAGSTLTLGGFNIFTAGARLGFIINGSGDVNVTGNLTSSGNSTDNLTYSGTGTLTIGGGFGLSGNGAALNVSSGTIKLTSAQVGAGMTVSGTGSFNETSAGSIGNTNGSFGGFTMSSSGTTTLAGSNTYQNGTNVSNGTFNLSGTGTISGGSAITVSGGAFNESGGAVISAGSTFTTTGGTTTLSGLNTYTGATSVNGGTLTLDFSGATAPTTATNIIKSTNTVNLGGGTLTIKGNTSGTNGQTFATTALTTLTASKVILNSNGATLNTTFGGFTHNAQSSMDVTLPALGTTTNTTSNALGGILVDSSKVAYATANGGTTWLAETGTTLSALSSYATTYTTATNNVDVANGDAPSTNFTVNTLRFNAATDALTLATGVNILNAGGILVTPTATAASISGAGTLTSGTTNTNAELVIHNYGSLNVGSVLANNGAQALNLTLTGSGGTTTLSAANTFSGQTALIAGTLNLSNQLALQNSTFQINTGTSLVFDQSVSGKAFTLGALSGAGNIALVNNATTPAAVALTVGGNNASTTYGGVLSGTGSLIKNGTGTFSTSQNQTYTGGLTINNGGVAAANGTNSFGSTGTLTLGLSGSANNVSYSTAGFNNPITVNPGTVASPGTATRTISPNTGASFNLGGAITLVGGGSLTIGSSNATITTTGGATGTGNIIATSGNQGDVFSTGALNMTGFLQNSSGGGNSITVNSVLGPNVTALIENPSNVASGIILTAVNTFPGDTTITKGFVNVRNSLALQNSVVVTNGTAAPLTFGTSTTVGLAAATLGGLSGSSNVALNDTLTPTPGAVALTIGNSNVSNGSATNPNTLTPVYSGVLSNGTSASAASVTKVGTNTQSFTGANTYTGATTVSGGVLSLGLAGTAGSATGGTLAASATGIKVNTGGTLLVAASNAVGNTTPVNMAGGTFSVAGGVNQGAGAHTSGGTVSGNMTTGGTVTGTPTTSTLGLGALTLSANSTLTFAPSGVSTLVFTSFNQGTFTLNVTGFATTAVLGSGSSGTDGTDDRLIFDQPLTSTQLGEITFNGYATATEVQLDGNFYEVIGVVPEPSTWFGGVFMLGAVAWQFRRRRAAN